MESKPEKLNGRNNLYKILNEYLDRKIQRDKDKIVEKYFNINSQENLLKSFTVNKPGIAPPKKK
jgi:hypothetical protein